MSRSSRIRSAQVPVTRGATVVFWGGLGVAVTVLAVAVLLKWYQHLPNLEDWRWRTLLTALGVSAGAWICRPIVVAAKRLPKVVSITGVIALLTSQVCYYTLVWGPWKASAMLWRAWWVSLVITVCVAHIAWVRLLIARRDHVRSAIRRARISWTCTAIALPLWIGLVLGQTPLPDSSLIYQIALVAPVVIGGIATLLLLLPAMLRRIGEASMLQRGMWAGVGVTISVLIGFYVGRITAPMPSFLEGNPAGLGHLSPAELDGQLTADFRRLKIVAAGLDELAAKAADTHKQLAIARATEKRDYYRPAEEDQVRSMFMSYLAYRAALLRLAATYANFQSIADPATRSRAFLIGYCAGATVMDASQALVHGYRDDASARRKLNEADDSCGIPAGTFDRIYAAVADSTNVDKVNELGAYFQTRREEWRAANVLNDADFRWIDGRITDTIARVRAGRLDTPVAKMEMLYDRVKRDVYSPVYTSQSIVSTLIGDTRMVAREPFISVDQIRKIQPQLRPGDICLERRNWFMSNAFLPGFWPHAALYVGTIEDLEKLGLARRQGNNWTSDNAGVRDHLPEFLKAAEDGEPCTILESVSEGVIPNSLTHSMHADYIAVLRPRKLSDADRAAALAKAFSHVGKPYDFEFDFFSADKLVCTELVYRSYDGLIKFDLVPIMGRSTLPAMEIARKFSNERSKEDRELDFVLFLDAVPREQSAKLGTADDFCGTIHRPRGFNE